MPETPTDKTLSKQEKRLHAGISIAVVAVVFLTAAGVEAKIVGTATTRLSTAAGLPRAEFAALRSQTVTLLLAQMAFVTAAVGLIASLVNFAYPNTGRALASGAAVLGLFGAGAGWCLALHGM